MWFQKTNFDKKNTLIYLIRRNVYQMLYGAYLSVFCIVVKFTAAIFSSSFNGGWFDSTTYLLSLSQDENETQKPDFDIDGRYVPRIFFLRM